MQGKKGRAHLLFVGTYEADIQAIVAWVGKRNEKGVAVNYEVWTTGNHTEEASRLQETGLEGKEGNTKKKAADKLVDMEAGSTVKDHILKNCP